VRLADVKRQAVCLCEVAANLLADRALSDADLVSTSAKHDCVLAEQPDARPAS
jgi:hypothetical protein